MCSRKYACDHVPEHGYYLHLVLTCIIDLSQAMFNTGWLLGFRVGVPEACGSTGFILGRVKSNRHIAYH